MEAEETGDSGEEGRHQISPASLSTTITITARPTQCRMVTALPQKEQNEQEHNCSDQRGGVDHGGPCPADRPTADRAGGGLSGPAWRPSLALISLISAARVISISRVT